MPNRLHMSWVASTRRWKKMFRGRMYVVSCRQLGAPETKEGSWRAANAWWEEQEAEASAPSEDDRISRARQVGRLVEDFGRLGEDARKEAVEALLGAGSYDGLKAKAESVVEGMDAPAADRTTAAQVEAWKGQLHAACLSGQLSEGRYDAYCRKIRPFTSAVASVDAIDESALDDYYARLSAKVGDGAYSPVTAHELMMTAKQFVRWMAERRLIPLPRNIDSRRFRFNHGAAKKIEVFTVDEVREILGRAGDRTRLFLLLMLNCGMYQNDVAELRREEVDWNVGVITRQRSKTRERNAPTVAYKLWPETFDLLKRHRNPDGDRILTTERGNPLVEYALKAGKLARYDAIQSAWNRMGKGRLGLKHFRKTSATLLGEHPQYKFYSNHFLADSPKSVADRHYVIPNDAEFFEALGWLRGRLLGAEGGETAS